MTMENILIWRHAEAEDVAPDGLDANRALTKKGQADAQRMAKWLKKHCPKETKIYCSPALRCQQTLEALLALKENRKSCSVEYTKILAIESELDVICQFLTAHKTSTLLLVGHQPLLGQLVSCLLSTQKNAGVEIKKGAVWWLRPNKKFEKAWPQHSISLMNQMEVLTVQHPKLLK
jgi:phosphohistidine phosphatase